MIIYSDEILELLKDADPKDKIVAPSLKLLVDRVAMLLVIDHRVWTDIQFPTELYAVHILLNRGIEVGEDIYHHMTFTSVESSLGYEVSQLRFDQFPVLPSVKSKMYALQLDVFEDLQISVIDQPNI